MIPLDGEAPGRSDGNAHETSAKHWTQLAAAGVEISLAKLEELKAQVKQLEQEKESLHELKEKNQRLKNELRLVKQMHSECVESRSSQSGPPESKDKTPKVSSEEVKPPQDKTPDVSSEPLQKENRPSVPEDEGSPSVQSGSASTCPTPDLPAGSAAVLFVPDAPDTIEMGMATRMHRMANAMVSVGLEVHVVVMNQLSKPPKTLPGMHVYSGTMHSQWEQAQEAAGKQLRAGVVFATMITVNLRKDLGKKKQWLLDRLNRVSNTSDKEHTKLRLHDTNQPPFTDAWPEETAVKMLSKHGYLPIIATDDVHYLRAPLVLEEAGLCNRDSSCPAIGQWMQAREMALYKSARIIFTVSTEDSQLIDKLVTKLIARERAVETSFASTDPCGKPHIYWIPYVENVVGAEDCAPFAKRKNGLLYLGGRHAVAEMGVDWLFETVQPELRRLGNGLSEGGKGHLYLVGPGWNKRIRRSAIEKTLRDAVAHHHFVTVTGEVTDEKLQMTMQRYKVLAAPAFNMTGVATKNIHALASGMPLVTTTEGLRGLGLPEGQEIVFVCDNATKFAEVVLKLQRNETLFHQAQARGLAHARKMFTMATQAEAICTALGCKGVSATLRETWNAWKTASELL